MAIVDASAVVSPHAIIGSPAEWRDRRTRFPAIVDEDAKVMALATVDAGADRPTIIGARALLMKQTHVGHDAMIGADCELAPGARIGGCARLGDGVKVGMNAVVLPGVEIGAGCIVGAGAVVTKDSPAGVVLVGNPARALRLADRDDTAGSCTDCAYAARGGPCTSCARVLEDRARA